MKNQLLEWRCKVKKTHKQTVDVEQIAMDTGYNLLNCVGFDI